MSSSGVGFSEQSEWDADPEVNDDLVLEIYREGDDVHHVLHDPNEDAGTPVDPDLLTPVVKHR